MHGKSIRRVIDATKLKALSPRMNLDRVKRSSNSAISRSAPASWRSFDPNRNISPALALRVDIAEYESEAPVHQHRKSQRVLALHGGMV